MLSKIITTILIFLVFGLRSQVLDFLYTNQQITTYNNLYTVVSIFTQNFDDQVSTPITITPFTMGGQAYNTIYVGTNGFVTLGKAAAANNYNPISIPHVVPVLVK